MNRGTSRAEDELLVIYISVILYINCKTKTLKSISNEISFHH